MGKAQQAAGGGLAQADKAKLVPKNIREGVTFFEGTNKQVTGSFGRLKEVFVGTLQGANGVAQLTISCTNVPGWQNLTLSNFKCIGEAALCYGQVYWTTGWMSSIKSPRPISYDASTGVLTIGNTFSSYWSDGNGNLKGAWSFNVYALIPE